MAIVKLHHVQVSCPKGGEDLARAFYGDTLGLAEVPKPPVLATRGGVWFEGGDFQVHIAVEEPFAPAKKAHPAFVVDDVDAAAADVEAAGHLVIWDDSIPGLRRFHTVDGHGNRVEIQSA